MYHTYNVNGIYDIVSTNVEELESRVTQGFKQLLVLKQ